MDKQMLNEINTAYYRLGLKQAEIVHAPISQNFSFVFPFDVEGKQIFEFVKLLRCEGFYY